MTRSQADRGRGRARVARLRVDATPSGAEISLVAAGFARRRRKLQPGDVIVEAHGTPVTDARRPARTQWRASSPARDVTITYRRSGASSGGSRSRHGRPRTTPSGPSSASSSSRRRRSTCPFDISIDAGADRRASAGLAFALDIVDELGQDVDQGRRIVVTGELGARRLGRADRRHQAEDDRRGRPAADLFVVPEENAAGGREHAATAWRSCPSRPSSEALGDLTAPEVVTSSGQRSLTAGTGAVQAHAGTADSLAHERAEPADALADLVHRREAEREAHRLLPALAGEEVRCPSRTGRPPRLPARTARRRATPAGRSSHRK